MSQTTTIYGQPVNTSIPNVDCTLHTCSLLQGPFTYVPSLAGNAFFTALFGLLLAVQLILGLYYRTTSFTIGMITGLILEIIGYAARIPMHFNPFPSTPFLIYLICITIGPIFITASIYLCLGRIIVIYGRDLSRLTPRSYMITFITLDFLSLLLQAGGGAMVEIANDFDFEYQGIHVMLGGLSLQVASLILFCAFWADYATTVLRRKEDWDERYRHVQDSITFKAFQMALIMATIAILIRSAFRVAELSQGFHGILWNNQLLFIVLEGGAVSFAGLCLTCLHPGPALHGVWQTAKVTLKRREYTAANLNETQSVAART